MAQAKRLHELDKEGKLNGDVIDGILSEEKKEDRGVIISTAELSKYFGKEVTLSLIHIYPRCPSLQFCMGMRSLFRTRRCAGRVGNGIFS